MVEQAKGKKIDESVKKIISDVNEYFNSLNKKEIVAWVLIGAGLILLILGIILL